MAQEPLSYLPGVCKVDSPFASSAQISNTKDGVATGRFTDMEGARFVAGYPEKLAGWVYTSTNSLTGVPRGLKDWRDLTGNVYLGIGTHEKLYVFYQGSATDITPFKPIQTGTLTNAFVTVSNSNVVTVSQGTHGLISGDYVKLVASGTVGGITPAGVFNPITSLGTNSYSFINTNPATGNGTGGGNILYTYYRSTINNPFTTVLGTSGVKVTQNNNGASQGDFVIFSGTSTVGGVSISGEYPIASILDGNNFYINASNNATSSTTGGGTLTTQYEIPIGTKDASTNFGYSDGGYSNGGYSSSTVGTTMPPRVWALSPYGQQLLAAPYGGAIYIWDPTIGGRAYPLYGAPATVLWMFVTPERFVFALGINGQLMQLAWPDQSDYTNWISLPTNTANSGRQLQSGSYMVGGIAVRDGVSLVFTNTALYPFTYSGDNNVYDDSIASDGCGLAGPLAVNTVAGTAFWMGISEFWMWNGVVSPMGSDDIRDFVFQNINLAQSYKFVCATNIAKKEVWFFYVSAGSSEIDSYIIFHLDQACWSKGTVLLRTSWIDRGLFLTPIATDANGYIYNQESGNDSAGQAMNSYIQYSPVSISKGSVNQDVFCLIPDFERQKGNLTLSVLTQEYPEDPPTVYGPYIMAADDSTPRIDLRVAGKMVGYEMTSNVIGGDWRLGLPTIELQPAGARR